MRDYHQLLLEQTTHWPLAKKNFRALNHVLTREFFVNGVRICVQFNPGRIQSSSADVSKRTIEQRPCFLCAVNRPNEQKCLLFQIREASGTMVEYHILVNPFPVFSNHYTIASTQHRPQYLRENMKAFLTLSKFMNDCVVFYNGPYCGASAPDHLHFQAGNKGLLPIEADFLEWGKRHLRVVWNNADTTVSVMKGLLRNGWVIESRNSDGMEAVLESLLQTMSVCFPTDREPMINVLCWYENERWIGVVFSRKKHRPNCYFGNENERLLISPAAVEMGGLIIAARKEDFERLDENHLRNIYCDVSSTENETDTISKSFLQKIPILI